MKNLAKTSGTEKRFIEGKTFIKFIVFNQLMKKIAIKEFDNYRKAI